ncbi:hypothetical protein [Rhodocyclus purpureus]|uniref:hypothetical protein n=1 Tax=Rhodocyclus purpureus TaxID=1067 RepID=UPI001912C558|nr:hypothetical protein [Rhodocyclus purpureus]MBK5912886.1 hypothetical protein [Rhodocyclus purpureus]
MEFDEKMAAGKTEEVPAQGANGPGKQSSLADWAPKLVGLLIPVALGLEAYGVYASRVDKAEAAKVEAAKLQAAPPVTGPQMEAGAESKRSAE